jgi:hypothetical protein
MADYDDDITAGFDDDPIDDTPLQADEDQLQQKETDFRKEVRRQIAVVENANNRSKKRDRLAAVRWLGYSGAPEAIPALVKVYKSQEEAEDIRKAAEDALGMYMSVYDLYDNPDTTDEAYSMWQSIILEGKRGQRVNYAAIRLRQLVLLVILILLLALAAFAPAISETDQFQGLIPDSPTPIPPTATPTATPDTPEIAAEQLRLYYDELVADAITLQEQYGIIISGETQDCDVSFNQPPPFELSPAGANDETLATISQELNVINQRLDVARTAFNELCEGTEPMPENRAFSLLSNVVQTNTSLRETANRFDEPVDVPPTPTVTPLPSPTPIDFSILRPHVDELEAIITRMSSPPQGTAVLLQNYWQNIEEFGRSEGCLQARFTYSEPYDLPDEIAAEFPQLQSATDSVNLGIDLAQSSGEAFFDGCDTSTFNNSQRQIQSLEIALNAFREAQGVLDDLRVSVQ